MQNGWIKLHRKLLDNPIAQNPMWLSLWVTLLLMANHDEESSFIWNGQRQSLKKGQLLTGRKKLSEKTGIPETTIERILQYLEKSGQIGQQKTQKYRVITIVKWNNHQNVDNRRTTDGQQTDTFKNLRSKEDKKDTSDVPSQDIQSFINLFKEINPSHERLFSNKTERASAIRLLKKYGLEKMTATLENLPKIINQPYAPRITTPYELERNLGKLLIFVEQNKNIIIKNKSNVI